MGPRCCKPEKQNDVKGLMEQLSESQQRRHQQKKKNNAQLPESSMDNKDQDQQDKVARMDTSESRQSLKVTAAPNDETQREKMLDNTGMRVIGCSTFYKDQDKGQKHSEEIKKIESGLKRILSFKGYQGFKTIDRIQDQYEMIKELGNGAFGSVMLAKHVRGETKCAIKIIKKSLVAKSKVYKKLMSQELEVLEKTEHPHIVRVIQLMEDQRKYYIVMELMPAGNLLDKILARGKLSEADAVRVIHQMMLALNYMHQQSITHRDLKLENLLCEQGDQLYVKLTDFGFACQFDPDELLDLSLGSPLYMSPELCNEEKYDQRVDVWSLGVIAYILLCGDPPFVGATQEETYQVIQKKNLTFTSKAWKNVSPEAQHFIKKCLIKDFQKRPQISELLEDNWLVKMVISPPLDSKNLLDITSNLASFKKNTVFQTGVTSFLTGMMAQSHDLDELRETFLQLDSNKDGFLTKEELQNGMDLVLTTFKATIVDWQEILDSVDINGDNKIDYQEFITAAINKVQILNKKNLDIAFNVFDENGDGQISREELKKVFSAGGKDNMINSNEGTDKENEIWDLIMTSVDQDNDGTISYEEFHNAMNKVAKQRATVVRQKNNRSSLANSKKSQEPLDIPINSSDIKSSQHNYV